MPVPLTNSPPLTPITETHTPITDTKSHILDIPEIGCTFASEKDTYLPHNG